MDEAFFVRFPNGWISLPCFSPNAAMVPLTLQSPCSAVRLHRWPFIGRSPTSLAWWISPMSIPSAPRPATGFSIRADGQPGLTDYTCAELRGTDSVWEIDYQYRLPPLPMWRVNALSCSGSSKIKAFTVVRCSSPDAECVNAEASQHAESTASMSAWTHQSSAGVPFTTRPTFLHYG